MGNTCEVICCVPCQCVMLYYILFSFLSRQNNCMFVETAELKFCSLKFFYIWYCIVQRGNSSGPPIAEHRLNNVNEWLWGMFPSSFFGLTMSVSNAGIFNPSHPSKFWKCHWKEGVLTLWPSTGAFRWLESQGVQKALKAIAKHSIFMFMNFCSYTKHCAKAALFFLE